MTIKHVLIVDDSKSARYMLRKMLGKINLTADLAESGEEAMTYLENKQPDAIFMDHMMPGMNGLETVQKIKTMPERAEIPVVMYTSQDGDEYVRNVKSHGVVDILPKPASPENLSAVVRRLNDLPQFVEVKPAVDQPSMIERVSSSSAQALENISLSIDDIEKTVRQIAETSVAAAVRYQVVGVIAQQLSNFRKELKLLDENMAIEVAERTFDIRINSFSNRLSQQMEGHIKELREKLDEVNSSKVEKIDPKTLEEIKSVARLASTSKAIDAARETANTVAHDTITKMTDAINEANTRMASKILSMSIVAGLAGVLSAITVYIILS